MVVVKQHSVSLMVAFRPVRNLLLSIGQMPFVERKKKDNTITYKFTFKSFLTPFFVIVFSLAATNFVLLTLGIFNFWLESSPLAFGYTPNVTDTTILNRKPRFRQTPDNKSLELVFYEYDEHLTWERLHVQRQLIPIVVVWGWMFSAIVGGIHVIAHGQAYTHFFNYWHRVVQAMDMDVTRGIRQYLYVENCFFLGIIIAIFIAFMMGVFSEIEVVLDIARVMANFVLRNFRIEITSMINQNNNTESWPFQYWLCILFGLFIIIFAYAGSRTNIVQFVFFCRILTNACTIFNDRLLAVLQSRNDDDQGPLDEMEKRKIHAHLFRDHLIIVQLFRMTDSLFAPILIPYYLFQVMIITLQLYNLFTLRKFGKYETEAYKYIIEHQQGQSFDQLQKKLIPDEAKENREWQDAIESLWLSLAFIAQGWIFVSITTSKASKAAEHAMAAFKIVRRNGYITCETKKERNLMHSLVFSFARSIPIRLTAGGYFPIDVSLLPALIGTMLNYIVAVYTVKPDVWEEDPPILLPPIAYNNTLNTTTTGGAG